jgi:hypothetical protein
MITLMITYEKRHSGAREIHHVEVTTRSPDDLDPLQGEVDDEGSKRLRAAAEGIVHEELYDQGMEDHILSPSDPSGAKIQCQNTTKINKRRAEPWELGKSSWLNAKALSTRWFALHPRHALLSPYLGHDCQRDSIGIDNASMGKMMILHWNWGTQFSGKCIR